MATCAIRGSLGLPEESRASKMKKRSESTTALVQLKREFGLWSAVSITVGCMIGSGIFVSPGSVARYTGSVGMALVVWVLSGLMCMVGALCFAELGTMMPHNGGKYAYILEVFGPVPAFLLLWVSFIIIGPGSGAIITITFANYLLQPFFPNCSTLPYWPVRLVALTLSFIITYINCRGVKFTKIVVNTLTITKLFALVLIIFLGFLHLVKGNIDNYVDPMEGTIYDITSFATAFYSTLFAYDGWNAINVIMDELKDPYRNLPKTIGLSLAIVTVVYTLTNMAYFALLTPSEVVASSAVAVTFGNRTLGIFAWMISIFVACSTSGSINGGVLLNSRLVQKAAKEGHLPKCFSHLNINTNTPVAALVGSVIFPTLMTFLPDIGSLLAYTTFTGALFDLLCILALLWLRYKEPDRDRPIKVWLGFPILYLILSVFICVFPVVRRPYEIGVSVFVILAGLVVYYLAIQRRFQVIDNAMDKVTRFCQLLFLSVEEEKEE